MFNIKLFERVTWERTNDKKKPARDFSDYEILLDGKTFSEIFKVVDVG